MIGQSIGNYKVVALLGAGGMGEVYLAEQLAIETRVAIKVLQKQISRDQEHVARFFNEARAVGKIKHPGTVKIFDSGFHDEHAYLVMELLEGESLAKRIERLVRLPGAMVAEITRQIAGILEAVHLAGVTHRDLKPDNVYLVADPELPNGERVKILDFGIAKLTGSLGGHSPQTKGTMGTPAYMAPEQWDDSSQVDGRADTYSLGCVTFEMLCGSPPFPAGSIAQACHHHIHTPPPSAVPRSGPLPAGLDEFLQSMLAKAPHQRPAIKEVARVFGELAAMDWSAPAASYLDPNVPLPVTPPGQPQTFPSTTPGYSIEAMRAQRLTPAPSRPITAPPQQPPEPAPIPEPVPNRTPLLIALGIVAAGGIADAIYFATRPGTAARSDGPVAAVPDGASPPTVDGALVVHLDAAPAPVDAAEPSPRERFAAANPFVDVGGVRLTRHQVTSREYRWLLGGGASDEDKPITWVTHAQATALCELLGARLPTSEEWERAAGGAWGITVDGVIGPLQEWTSTIRDELAVVRGGYLAMTPAQHAKARGKNPPYWLQKDPATGDRDPQIRERAAVAAAHLGFRCAEAR